MFSSALDFRESVVVVTGAGSGIGREAALAFAEAGARVLGVGRRADALSATSARHAGVASFVGDVTQAGIPQAVVDEAVRRWGRLDVLVNNAGAFTGGTMQSLDPDAARRLLEVNVVAPSMLARAAVPVLTESRGSIVNVSSTFGHRPVAGAAQYAASKAALEHLTRCWALELAAQGVRVNCIAPGPTESEALEAAGLSQQDIEDVKAEEIARIPLGRRGEARDIAGWILRVADRSNSWMTGQVVSVDGGLNLT